MHEVLLTLLECPVCRSSLSFEGTKSGDRFVNGSFRCTSGHVYQVKEEIGLLKDAKVSAKEFSWKVDVADEKRYDKINKQYNSYLTEEQKTALDKLLQKLLRSLAASCEESDNKVLDIASGMGRFILPLAERSAEDLLIIGTDVDERPLRGAMSKAKRADTYRKISLIVTDAKHLSFKSNILSTISSHFGFDNVPDAALAFKEAARVLRRNGKVIFSSLWLEENSESMRLAEKHHVAQMASERRLQDALGKSGLSVDWVEKMFSGVGPYNPMDLLPAEGDAYTHVIVQARKSGG